MKNQNLNITLLVDQSPKEVFDAIKNVRGWWSEEVEGGTEKLNDEFRYHYKDVHYCKVRLVEIVPEQKIVWHVIDNRFSFTENESEWTDTTICFRISQQGKQTQLVFEHIGLVPEYECYEVCREGWTNYINKSLRNLITTGKGQPNPKEGGFNEALAEKWNLNLK
jgi:hypothetical protein